MSAAQRETVISLIQNSANTVGEAAEAVEEAATRVESNVVDGIQPDISEIRMYISELSEAANIRQKRLTWAVWALAAINLVTVGVVLWRT